LIAKHLALEKTRHDLTDKELEVIDLTSKIELYEDTLTSLGVKVDQLDGIIDAEDALNISHIKEKLAENDAVWRTRLEAAVKDLKRFDSGSCDTANNSAQSALESIKIELQQSRRATDENAKATSAAETESAQISVKLQAEIAGLKRVETGLRAQIEVSDEAYNTQTLLTVGIGEGHSAEDRWREVCRGDSARERGE